MPDDTLPVAVQPAGHPTPGGLLSGQALEQALFSGERIFRSGSAARSQVRGAGYELRLAGDRMMLPVQPGSDTFSYRDPAQAELPEITLQPGDSALIFSAERFSMDFDVTCLIGPKFRWAVRGLLVLQGMAAHPGYGRELREGNWVPKEDERLSLVVANIGPKPIVMRRGDPIAYVQFFEVERPASPREVRNVGYEELVATFQAGGLAYFKEVRDLKASVAASEQAQATAVSEALSTHKTEMTKLQERVNAASNQVDRVQNSTLNVVIFGVFLVAITLLGIVVTTLVNVVVALPDKVSLSRGLWIGGLCVAYLVAAVWGVAAVVRGVGARDPKDSKK